MRRISTPGGKDAPVASPATTARTQIAVRAARTAHARALNDYGVRLKQSVVSDGVQCDLLPGGGAGVAVRWTGKKMRHAADRVAQEGEGTLVQVVITEKATVVTARDTCRPLYYHISLCFF